MNAPLTLDTMTEDLLLRSLDGTLSAAEEQHLAARLAAEPALDAELQQMRSFDQFLRSDSLTADFFSEFPEADLRLDLATIMPAHSALTEQDIDFAFLDGMHRTVAQKLIPTSQAAMQTAPQTKAANRTQSRASNDGDGDDRGAAGWLKNSAQNAGQSAGQHLSQNATSVGAAGAAAAGAVGATSILSKALVLAASIGAVCALGVGVWRAVAPADSPANSTTNFTTHSTTNSSTNSAPAPLTSQENSTAQNPTSVATTSVQGSQRNSVTEKTQSQAQATVQSSALAPAKPATEPASELPTNSAAQESSVQTATANPTNPANADESLPVSTVKSNVSVQSQIVHDGNSATITKLKQDIRSKEQSGDAIGAALLSKQLGVVQRGNGLYSAAQESFDTALRTAQKLGVRDLEAETLGEIGLLEAKQGNKNAALQSLRRCVSTLEAASSSSKPNAKTLERWKRELTRLEGQ
jgi:hypothetical protein